MSRLLLLTGLLAGCSAKPVDTGSTPSLCSGDAAPGTIAEMIDHLNHLPMPVTVPCLLDSLARPLQVELTDNPVSAQPADSSESPRVFVFTGDLVTSLVPSGDGSGVIEFGEADGPEHSRKGEVAVPVQATLAADAPFTKVEHPDFGTICAGCHPDQSDHPDGGTTSMALAPDPRSLVPVSELRAVAEACRPDARTGACGTLVALFRGPVEHRSFPSTYRTIFELTE